MKRKRKFFLLKFRRKLDLRNLNITSQMFTIFSFVFVLIILLSFLNYSNYRKDKSTSTLNAIDSMNSQILDKIDGQIDSMKSISKLPYSYAVNNNSNAFLTDLDNSYTEQMDLNFPNLLNQLYHDAMNYNYDIHSVFVFNMKGLFQHASSSVEVYPDYNPINEKWFKNSIDNKGSPSLLSTFNLPYLANVKGNSAFVFSLSRAIVDINDSKIVGVILVNTKIDFISNLCDKLLFVPNQRIAIIDSDNNVIYDTVTKNITKKFDSDISHTISHSSSTDNILNIKGEKYLISSRTSTAYNWKIVNIIPENELNKSISILGRTTIVLTVLIILIALTSVIFLTNQITKPIKKLALLMKLIENGDFNVKIKLRNRNEIGQLARTFNNMTRKVNKLINEVYVDKITQKELEVQMLQNQINPHFLYNTLESIHMMAEINEDEETSTMVRALGRILRYGISKKHEKVTVKQELDNINDYILLQKIRFSNIFDIKVNIDPNLYDFIIIKLIFQPLVENAIYHGLDETLSGGLIEITGEKSDNNLIFMVKDNGKGMDESSVIKMNNNLNDVDNSMSSIGLKNVSRRIKLKYGNDYGLEVSSVLGEYTAVKILLPAVIKNS